MADLTEETINGAEAAEQLPPIGEITMDDMVATIGELEVGRRLMVNVINRLNVENAALKARIAFLEAEETATAEPEE